MADVEETEVNPFQKRDTIDKEVISVQKRTIDKINNTNIINDDGDVSKQELATSTTDRQYTAHKRRKRKTGVACLYCRRSHVLCNDERPCARCIKRGIQHLCHDENITASGNRKNDAVTNMSDIIKPHTSRVTNADFTDKNRSTPSLQQNLNIQPVPTHLQEMLHIPDNSHKTIGISGSTNTIPTNATSTTTTTNNNNHNKSLNFINQPIFISEHVGSEFSSLNEFLTMLENPLLLAQSDVLGNIQPDENNTGTVSNTNLIDHADLNHIVGLNAQTDNAIVGMENSHNTLNSIPSASISSRLHSISGLENNNMNTSNALPSHIISKPMVPSKSTTTHNVSTYNQNSTTPKENFFLTAADPSMEMSPEERLKQVINAKLDAGLLRPYNYAQGYARLQSYMDKYMNTSSKSRILKPLSIIRPAFRAIARGLKDVDLILVEECFERMLLSYERVFTSMSMPACLWRRTGEIYRGNKEFASLVSCTVDDLRDGKLAIYELMTQESAVNFWEKYGSIAFDKGQKAVLTSCNLRTKNGVRKRPCCFSFTIRRDRYNIPICIVGNFIPIS
ncbi:related to Regulator of drug sensitivity 2 [Saccharomycodes ludwigii]|uniref:Related to Regulator of drug sensitivity 2 n=1 Tax=Saccharomycodes ludwigii TaxID=36035 RepID=A0A376B3U4_9ASCO|nr:related to Regulator of drug sensitivity 2 [Saccharomycodes ludwigii]